MCLESHSRARFALQRRKVVLGHPVAKLAKLGFGSRYNSALFFFFFAAHVLAESSPGTDTPSPHPESVTVTNFHSAVSAFLLSVEGPKSLCFPLCHTDCMEDEEDVPRQEREE